jgi:hypothetical protein
MDWKHPTYYKALAKQRRDFEVSEREQANKQERERASKRRLTSKKRRLTSD